MLSQFVMTYLPMIWMCFQLIIVTLRYQITESQNEYNYTETIYNGGDTLSY